MNVCVGVKLLVAVAVAGVVAVGVRVGVAVTEAVTVTVDEAVAVADGATVADAVTVGNGEDANTTAVGVASFELESDKMIPNDSANARTAIATIATRTSLPISRRIN